MLSNIVKFNYLKSESRMLRLDSDFYSKELIEYDKRIKNNGFNNFGNLISTLTDYTANGSFASLAKNVNVVDNIDYAKWIRIQNLDNEDFVNDVRYVDKQGYSFLKKSKLIGGELLLSKTGEYLGKCYIFNPLDTEKYTLADNIFLLRLKEEKLKEYIYVYINSEIGNKMLLRWSQGTGQPTIIKDNLRELKVPIVTDAYLEIIKKIINIKFDYKTESVNKYNKALRLLEDGILNVKKEFSIKNNSCQKFSDVIKKEFRMDSEYYLPKYFELEEYLRPISIVLSKLVSIEKSVDPGSSVYTYKEAKNAIPFLRIANLTKNGFKGDFIYLDSLRIKNINKLYIKQNDILLSKDGSVGISYVSKEDYKMIPCGGILRLRINRKQELVDKNFSEEYLSLVLNSRLTKMQAERDCGGSILEHWKKEQIENIMIPILPSDKMKEITDLMTSSFKLLELSNKYFDIAKSSINVLINEGEQKAIEYIKMSSIF